VARRAMTLKSDCNHRFQLFPQIICRTPAFAASDELTQRINDVKEYISDASAAFYEVIKDLNVEEILNSDEKIFFAFWKYFNRSKHRATPFGRFAAISVVPMHMSGPEATNVVLDKNTLKYSFIDWDEKEHASESSAGLVEMSDFFVANSTLYLVGSELRYYSNPGSRYELGNVERFDELDYIIKTCKKKISKAGLLNKISSQFNLSYRSTIRLLIQLVDLQLIWCDRMPNITGIDYFKRINFASPKSKSYIITERPWIEGSYDGSSLKSLPELISFLNKNLPFTGNSNLEQFKKAFIKKFDRQIIPLSVALDPELGIEYAGLSAVTLDDSSGSFSEIFERKAERVAKQNPKSPFLNYIFNRLLGQRLIALEGYEIVNNDVPPPLPNTLGVLFRNNHKYPVIEQIGGSTINQMLGRFTLAVEDIEKMCRQIAELEQDANPQTLFFDVSYHAEKHIDNINRRKHLYRYELALSGWSTADESLNLDDIRVCVHQGEVILLSDRHKKRLVPRIPTAYNFNRADLTLYRFLSDLQSQSIRVDLTLRVRSLFPGLSHYSRIEYKGIVLSPETWLVPDTIIKLVQRGNEELFQTKFLLWIRENEISQHFRIGDTDQTLTFDVTEPHDMSAFIIYCRQNGNSSIYLAEALNSIPRNVTDQNGQPFHSEILLPVYHNQQIYAEFPFDHNLIARGSALAERNIYPGDDWLYFEIYSHPARSNDLISNKIATFLKRSALSIKRWFFIRYTENGYHLRLRVQLSNHSDCYTLITRLKDSLKSELAVGKISDLQIKTYVRELERYGVNRIHLAETYFHYDSLYVLKILRRKMQVDSLYDHALNNMNLVIGASFSDWKSKLEFVQGMAQNFSSEFNLQTPGYKLINKRYQQFTREKADRLACRKAVKVSKSYISAMNAYINACANEAAITAFAADAIHLHINRLFPTEQRKHEAILYQYLLKDMKKIRPDLALIKQSLFEH
jgi:thiopeptide-type bacteriocin biosynthesis protein